MGNKVSKEEPIEPPPEWDPSSNAKKFELVSPMSDLSDPSMFLHRQQQQQQLQRTKPPQEPPGTRLPSEKVLCHQNRRGGAAAGAVRQTPAADRRRKSKVIATQDSAYKHEHRERELPPPACFYFPSEGLPSKEKEESLIRLMARKSSSTGARRVSKESDKKQVTNDEHNNNKTAPFLVKAKRQVNKATDCLTGCFEESNHKIQLMKDNVQAHRQHVQAQRLSVEMRGHAALKDGTRKLYQPQEHGDEQGFDPYEAVENLPVDKATSQHQPTVLQFIDGAEHELTFNPVWRESQDGTYYTTTTTSCVERESEPTSTAASCNMPRRSSGISDLRSHVHRKSGRNSRPSELFSQYEREHTRPQGDPIVRKRSQDAPGDEAFNLSRDDSFKNVKAIVSNLIGMYDQRKSTDEMSQEQQRLSVDECSRANGLAATKTNKDRPASTVTSTSEATSHESSYWNAYYKDVQVLHHDDAYIDKIAYNPRQSFASSSKSTATSSLQPKGLLINLNTPALKHETSTSYNDDKENNPAPADEEASNESASVKGTAVLPRKNETHIIPKMNKEPLVAISSPRPPQAMTDSLNLQRKSYPIDSNCLPKSSFASSIDCENAMRTCKSFDQIKRQPSDENLESSKHQSLKNNPEAAYSKNDSKFALLDKTAPKTSFLDQRTSAKQVLVQSKLASTTQSKPQSLRPYVHDVLQETPRASIIPAGTSSFGSAYSYKDKDAFTPVTSSTTYPKGSPFRPRINAPNKAVAQAKIDQPAMYTQSFDSMSRSSRDMQIQATESAPSMIESHDYRDIAYGCFLEDTPTTVATKKERALAVSNPNFMSLESPMSTAESPGQPLLSDQARSNAAFLFSPSYASESSLLTLSKTRNDISALAKVPTQIEEAKRESTSFSISTFGSRSRTSRRSQHSIRIPVSIHQGISTYPHTVSSETASRQSNRSDRTSSKSVRFSDAHSIAPSEAASSQKSRHSVTWNFSFKTDADENTAAPKDVSIPAIESKVSDLADPVFERESNESSVSKRESVESVESESQLDHFASRPTQESPETNTESIAATPEEMVRTWKYCEFTKGVTPFLQKNKSAAQATDSPVLRFKAAKNKFVVNGKQEKAVPVKKKSPSISKKKIVTGRVHALASKFDNGGPPLEPRDVVSSGASLDGTSVSTAGSTSLPGDRPMLRTPQILGYKAKTCLNIHQKASLSFDAHSVATQGTKVFHDTNPKYFVSASAEPGLDLVKTPLINNKKAGSLLQQSPSDEETDMGGDDFSQQSYDSNDDSTFIQSVATVLKEGNDNRHSNVAVVENDPQDNHAELDKILDAVLESSSAESQADMAGESQGREDLPCDEAADDFAELLLNEVLGSASSTGSGYSERPVTLASQHSESSNFRLQSVISEDEDDGSTFTNILSAPTFSDESTSMSAVLAEQTSAKLRQSDKTVQPQAQTLHAAPSSHSLYLSPNMRTPMQASKWRELAQMAQQEDSKRSIFKSSKTKKQKNPKRLSERNTNVIY